MPLNLRALLLHAASVAIMAHGYMNLPDMIGTVRMSEKKGGQFQFLTIQGLLLAFVTMVVSLAVDLIPSSRWLRNVKRAVLIIALPVSIVISTIYWNLLLFMPHMIIFTAPDATTPTSSTLVPEPARLPLSLDLALHAVPAVAMFIDFYFFERKYTGAASRWGPIVLAAIFGSWYSWWVEYCASYNGFFPYPFLTENPYNVRLLIYLGATSFAAISFKILNALHS
ncbi:FAR-17a/AIG1-like protein [Trametes elegans]|nr:FAR-17a/AIG1-like protein [Trametes elegans]